MSGERSAPGRPPAADLVAWFRRRVRRWCVANCRDFPWRRTREPFAVLVAETLLQATLSAKVAPVYMELMRLYPDARAMASAPRSALRDLIRPLGLQHRAERLSMLSAALCAIYDGRVPDTEEELLRLPGIGHYTAGAVLCFAFGVRAGLADTNVVRILERFFGIPGRAHAYRGSPSRALRDLAWIVTPPRSSRAFNLGMIDLGALVCRSTRPRCGGCPLRSKCAAASGSL